jgi:hypothetical protein
MFDLLKFPPLRQRTSRKRKSNLRSGRLIAQVQLRIIQLLARLDPEIGGLILAIAASRKCRKRKSNLRNRRLRTKNPATVINIGHWKAGKQE